MTLDPPTTVMHALPKGASSTQEDPRSPPKQQAMVTS